MRGRMKVAGAVAALAGAALLGAFAASGFGDSGVGSLSADRDIVGPVPLEPADGSKQAGSRVGATRAGSEASAKGSSKQPQITQLITQDPLTVDANAELVAVVRCPKKQRPVSGGAITPAAPANVSINVLSRFNPNTLAAPSRKFYVGVRNADTESQQWLATVTCMKNVKEK